MAKQLLEPPIGHEIVIWNFCFSLTPSRRCSRIRRQRRIGTTRRSTATRPTIPFGRPMGRPRFTPTTTRSMRPSRIFFFNFDKKSFDIHHSHVVSVYRTKRFMLDVAGVVVILSLPPLPFIMRFFLETTVYIHKFTYRHDPHPIVSPIIYPSYGMKFRCCFKKRFFTGVFIITLQSAVQILYPDSFYRPLFECR